MKTRKKACKDLIDRIVEKFGLTKEKAETIVKFLFLEITKAEKMVKEGGKTIIWIAFNSCFGS